MSKPCPCYGPCLAGDDRCPLIAPDPVAALLRHERDSLATQLDDAKQAIVTFRATMEQMRRERDEARAHAEERTAKVRDLARCAAASEARARAYAAKLARIREVAECDYHDTPRTVLRIIDEKEGGQ